MGAFSQEVHVPRVEPGPQELRSVGGLEVEEVFVRSRGMRRQTVELQALVLEPPPYVLPDLVAAFSDARSEGGQEIGRFSSVPRPERGRGFFRQPEGRAPPAAVKGSHNPAFLVGQKDGQAIGRPDHEEDAGKVRGQGIPHGRRFIRPVDEMDPVGMDLLGRDHGESRSDGGQVPGGPIRQAEPVKEKRDPVPAGNGQKAVGRRGGHAGNDSFGPDEFQGGRTGAPPGRRIYIAAQFV